MHWFYDPTVSAKASQIDAGELKHFAALRIRSGDEIVVTDGAGQARVFRVENPKSGAISFQRELVADAPSLKLHLIQALAKGDRDEQAVQAAVELGVNSVTPWQAANSVSIWRGKEEKGRSRWQQIAISAMKQSQQATLCQVEQLRETANLKPKGHGVLLVPGARQTLSDLPDSVTEFTLVVGPEGGITEDEIAQLAENGFQTCRLGSSVLRTSTAGPAAIAAIQALRGEWRSA